MLHSYVSARMIRRLKEDVLTGLPVKEVKIAHLDPQRGTMRIGQEETILPGDYKRQLSLYKKVSNFIEGLTKKEDWSDEEELEQEAQEDKEGQTGAVPLARNAIQLMRMEQAALDPGSFEDNIDSIKFDAVEQLVKDRLAQGKSVVIFFKLPPTFKKFACQNCQDRWRKNYRPCRRPDASFYTPV